MVIQAYLFHLFERVSYVISKTSEGQYSTYGFLMYRKSNAKNTNDMSNRTSVVFVKIWEKDACCTDKKNRLSVKYDRSIFPCIAYNLVRQLPVCAESFPSD
jgi:hypothetical protein